MLILMRKATSLKFRLLPYKICIWYTYSYMRSYRACDINLDRFVCHRYSINRKNLALCTWQNFERKTLVCCTRFWTMDKNFRCRDVKEHLMALRSFMIKSWSINFWRLHWLSSRRMLTKLFISSISLSYWYSMIYRNNFKLLYIPFI